MNRVKVKICGLTRCEDVTAAVNAGADVVGFVFAASPRQISVKTALQLVNKVPQEILTMGLFMNQSIEDIDKVVNAVPLGSLQFHGSESSTFCNRWSLPYLKAVSMQDGNSARQAENLFPDALGLLLDSHGQGGSGGSGKVFDWKLATPLSKPVWLAGGLNAQNVAKAISIVRPYAVDVSSGVESAPGIKDPDRITEFINAAHGA